jgi:hypothetical protein
MSSTQRKRKAPMPQDEEEEKKKQRLAMELTSAQAAFDANMVRVQSKRDADGKLSQDEIDHIARLCDATTRAMHAKHDAMITRIAKSVAYRQAIADNKEKKKLIAEYALHYEKKKKLSKPAPAASS